jgi:hypothetical protein
VRVRVRRRERRNRAARVPDSRRALRERVGGQPAPPFCRQLNGGRLTSPDQAVIEKVSSLLREAAETHHRVYRITDGDDADWASWYADWLTRLSELPSLLSSSLVRSEVVYLLVRLDKEYVANQPGEPWEQYYAARIVDHFGGK